MLTLDGLLQEVAQKRAKFQSKESDSGATDYAEVWNAYVEYLKTCLEQKRGLHLSNFCKVGWHTSRGGKGSARPVFQLTDHFCRAYLPQEAARKQAAILATDADLSSLEDFNFSKAAIKFSQQLTKDQMFTGLRSIVQTIGEAMSEGREVSVRFGDVGKLICRERDPRFHFISDNQGLEGLEASTAPLAEGGRTSGASFRRSAPEEAKHLGVRGSASGAQLDATNRRPLTPPPEDAEVYPDPLFEGGGGGYNPQLSRAASEGRLTAASGTSSRGRTPILSNQQFKREVAYKEAMDRHIGEMESRASEVMMERAAWNQHINECMSQEMDDMQQKRLRAKENSHFLEQQIHLYENKKRDQRKEDIVAASAHEFPKFAEPAESEKKDFVHGQQARMRADLDDQVRTNATLRNLAKQRERALELNQLEANRQEMAMLRNAERAKRAYDREALATAWNSEIRMKNVWKAIDNHNKVGSHVPQVLSTDDPPMSRGSSVLSAGRIMTGSSRKVPLGASSSLTKIESRLSTGRKL